MTTSQILAIIIESFGIVAMIIVASALVSGLKKK